MSTSYYGSTISLISKSDIRYEGILYSIDTNDSTIALAKARSFGTENRMVANPVAPRDEVYEYIIFRATDIKDLIVQDAPGTTSQPSSSGKILTDPAIIQVQSMPGLGSTNVSKSFTGPLTNLGNGTGESVNNPTVSSSTNRTMSNLSTIGLTNKNQSSQESQSSLSGPTITGPTFGSSADFRSGGSTPTPGLRRSPVSDAGVQMPSPAQNHREEKNQSSQVLNRDGRMQNYSSNYRPGNERRLNIGPSGLHGNYQRRPILHPTQPPMRHMPPPPPLNFRGGRAGPPMGSVMMTGGPKRGPMLNRAPPQPRVYQNTRPQQPRMSFYNRSPMNKTLKDKATLKISDDYDFEKANKEFEELENKFSKIKVEENSELEESKSKENQNETNENENEKKENDEENVFYDKTKSFFDKISCEAIERSKGKINRVDWRKERKINAETFGLNVNNFRRGGYRGRGGYLSGYTGYSRQNFNSNRRNPGVMGNRVQNSNDKSAPDNREARIWS